MILPQQKVKASSQSPKKFIFYSQPKMGKTTILSQLPDCLILDLENGTKYVDALKVNVTSLDNPDDETSLLNILREIYKAGMDENKNYKCPYKYIAVDTVTKLEEWCDEYATKMYKETTQGKAFKGKSVVELPNGAGYFWTRQALQEWIAKIEKISDNTILVGHLKEKLIDKNGGEVLAKDIDLTGKMRTILCASADAIALLYRDKGKLMMCFESSDEITCGSRCEHLKGKRIEISNSQGVADWSKIYLD